jgi:hypothetical protein
MSEELKDPESLMAEFLSQVTDLFFDRHIFVNVDSLFFHVFPPFTDAILTE